MKYLIEFRYDPSHRQTFREAFESIGFSRISGASLVNGWVSTKDCTAFLLAEASDANRIEEACRQWSQFGTWTIHPVHDLEQV